MNNSPPEGSRENGHHERWLQKIRRKEERRLLAKKEKHKEIWFGLGMFGLVGWAVTIPTVIGIAIGVWLDRKYPSQFSFTLMGLAVGVVGGCLNAWYWVKREFSGNDG